MTVHPAVFRERQNARCNDNPLVGASGERPGEEEPMGVGTVAVGSIARRPAVVAGALQEREHLCLTVLFDHDIVDGAPAARFTRRFAEQLSTGDELCGLTGIHL